MELATVTTPKGGHWPGGEIRYSNGEIASTDDLIFDFLYERSRDGFWSEREWSAKRIQTRHTHGTGCTLASAIATLLAQGSAMEHAVAEARTFVRRAIEAAPGFGSGAGPMGHQAVR
jgi:hydroxymethylpyrimidine/phosphomethylpyrimidine kinase